MADGSTTGQSLLASEPVVPADHPADGLSLLDHVGPYTIATAGAVGLGGLVSVLLHWAGLERPMLTFCWGVVPSVPCMVIILVARRRLCRATSRG